MVERNKPDFPADPEESTDIGIVLTLNREIVNMWNYKVGGYTSILGISRPQLPDNSARVPKASWFYNQITTSLFTGAENERDNSV
ncbi:hypothetical protein HNY73_005206 [Argiope bruennichi]|uniref:Uncharacterized protein n=1 Tax=Argiope bruennichi TaxID=94029 RepID=A0A8T0FKR5_ARGBR|nr:hypothetical protein HNY73_005206 [Argiope bruennichi]